MPYRRPTSLCWVACALLPALFACQQLDQELPFAPDDGAGRSASIGATGGLISVPPGFALEFPTGSLSGTTNVTAAKRVTSFPSTAGLVVPGTAYDVGPAGVGLNSAVPARVQLSVPESLLGSGDDILLAVALLRQTGSVVTHVTSYDVSNGILTADVDSLGPLAVVVVQDAIPVGQLAAIPTLGGGSMSPPTPVAQPTGPSPAPAGTVVFSAQCSVEERQCLSSGIVQMWADDVVRARLGNDIVLVNTTVQADVEFSGFVSNVPTQIYGYIAVDGDLRARLNSVVAGRSVGDNVALYTGPGTSPAITGLTFVANQMILAQSSQGPDEDLDYLVAGIGTGEQLTIRLEGDLEFSNKSGPPTVGHIVADIRLRR